MDFIIITLHSILSSFHISIVKLMVLRILLKQINNAQLVIIIPDITLLILDVDHGMWKLSQPLKMHILFLPSSSKSLNSQYQKFVPKFFRPQVLTNSMEQYALALILRIQVISIPPYTIPKVLTTTCWTQMQIIYSIQKLEILSNISQSNKLNLLTQKGKSMRMTISFTR